MQGSLSHEWEVRVPSSVVWETYGTLALSEAVVQLLPGLIEKVEVVEGDGGVGTVLALTFAQASPAFSCYKEKFVKLDNANRVKETEVVEGGYLLLGFTKYLIRLEVIEKEDDAASSIIKSTIEYEIAQGSNADPSTVTTKALEMMAQTVGKHLEDKYASSDNA
ncbi:hypothetical protein ACLOJK_030546 [Asimina triloba]